MTLDIDGEDGNDFSPTNKVHLKIHFPKKFQINNNTVHCVHCEPVVIFKKVKVVFVMARVHPGETPASFVVQV